MTNKQQLVVEKLQRDFFKNVKDCYKEAEFKEITIDECKYFISLVMEVGSKEDEGTLASILCRYRIHLFIGPKGGITYPTGKSSKRFKDNFFSVIIAQK